MKTFTQWLVEGRAFVYGGKKYSSGLVDGLVMELASHKRNIRRHPKHIRQEIRPL
jgi:hypothetical protein